MRVIISIMNMVIKNGLVQFRIFFTIFLQFYLFGQDNDLIFIPDSGIRIDSSGISRVVIDTSGLYLIYYNRGPDQGLAVSEDGLNFSIVSIQDYPDYRYHIMPDSSRRRYFVEIENDTARLKSRSSNDGSEFIMDPGYRYVFPPNDAITSLHVYTTYFNNALGEVYIVYLAGEIDNARSIHSESEIMAGILVHTPQIYLVILFWVEATKATGIRTLLFYRTIEYVSLP